MVKEEKTRIITNYLTVTSTYAPRRGESGTGGRFGMVDCRWKRLNKEENLNDFHLSFRLGAPVGVLEKVNSL